MLLQSVNTVWHCSGSLINEKPFFYSNNTNNNNDNNDRKNSNVSTQGGMTASPACSWGVDIRRTRVDSGLAGDDYSHW